MYLVLRFPHLSSVSTAMSLADYCRLTIFSDFCRLKNNVIIMTYWLTTIFSTENQIAKNRQKLIPIFSVIKH